MHFDNHLFIKRAAAALLISGLLGTGISTKASGADSLEKQLENGEVVTALRKVEDRSYVAGTILIDESPLRVWPIMTNPFEFEGKISPRMKGCTVMVDKVDLSLLKCTMHIGFFIPDLTYVVESKYEPVQRIAFKRIAGDLKDFRGYWEVRPTANGAKTELTYSMYIDPGFPVPQWIIREGVKMELPRMLNALRDRIKGVYCQNQPPESHSILAASTVAKTGLLDLHHEMP